MSEYECGVCEPDEFDGVFSAYCAFDRFEWFVCNGFVVRILFVVRQTEKKRLTINANWLYAKLIVSCRPSSPPAPSRLFSRCFHHTQTSIRRKFWLKLSVFSNSRRQCLEACKRLVRRIFIMNCVAGQLSQYSVAKPSKKTRRFIVAEQTSALLRTIKIAIFGRRTK